MGDSGSRSDGGGDISSWTCLSHGQAFSGCGAPSAQRWRTLPATSKPSVTARRAREAACRGFSVGAVSVGSGRRAFGSARGGEGEAGWGVEIGEGGGRGGVRFKEVGSLSEAEAAEELAALAEEIAAHDLRYYQASHVAVGGGGGVLISCMAVVLRWLTLVSLQCRDGACRASIDQADIACTKREAP